MPDSKDEQELSREAAERAAAAARIQDRSMLADLQTARAVRRGESGNLPGPPKPGEGDADVHGVERVSTFPASLALRKEDAELDDVLDRYSVEAEVRRHVEDFNERVIKARDAIPGGPPLSTMPRDVDATVDAWRERFAAYQPVPRTEPAEPPAKRHWWNRLNRRR
jgi:hypothetical protein